MRLVYKNYISMPYVSFINNYKQYNLNKQLKDLLKLYELLLLEIVNQNKIINKMERIKSVDLHL